MDPKIFRFLIAGAFLVGIRLLLHWNEQRDEPEGNSPPGHEWSLPHFLFASFLTLFAELALIRWIAVEVRIFAYFKNLALLVCFLGFGVGCALTRKRGRWQTAATAFVGLLFLVSWPFQGGRVVDRLTMALGGSSDVQIWAAEFVWRWGPSLVGLVLAGILLLLITCVFVPLGQTVSQQIDVAPSPLYAYSWNLVGSLAGIVAFIGVAHLMLPPVFWLVALIPGFALLQTRTRERLLLLSLTIPVVLLLRNPGTPDHFSIWTPYQEIEFGLNRFPGGEFRTGQILVNHTGYQHIVDLSSTFLEKHPGLLTEPVDENPYNLPFRFSTSKPSVLIVGAGTGNDTAAAVRNDSRMVDAVEIDPAILSLGKQKHPEHPYDSPQVHVHLTDARAFLKGAHQKYDLILFGLLDSHTQLSDYSNMRIDNFVYTLESMREARQHLNPDGILFLKFQVGHPWMGRRLMELLTQTFGKSPLTFEARSSYTVPSTCFVSDVSDRANDAVRSDARLAEFVNRNRRNFLDSPEIPVTTDDWPYLYHRDRRIPRAYLFLSILVLLLGLAFYAQIPEARSSLPSPFFFCMGAGFLLLETQVISRLALYFGTTWEVNGIVIAALLTALLISNVVVQKQSRPWPRWAIVAGLIAALLIAYLFPFSRISHNATIIGSVAAAVFAVPVFFAGVLFAIEFRRTRSPSAALGANMLGAVMGGLMENLSLLIGMRALLLVAIGLYCCAAGALRTRTPQKAEVGVPTLSRQ